MRNKGGWYVVISGETFLSSELRLAMSVNVNKEDWSKK